MAKRRKQPADWVRSEADRHAYDRGCRFDEAKARHVVDFFGELRHVNGEWAGKPFEPMDWQRDDILYPLFGWLRPNGKRRYRIAYIEIPKKNGKSELAGALALYLLAGDGEPGAEVYCAASARDQAAIVYRRAAVMAKACPMIHSVAKYSDSVKNIAIPSTNSFLRAISADAGIQEGHDIHGCVIDELHRHPNRNLWDALIKGGRARSQPLIVAITTAGWDRHSICYIQHTHAAAIIAGDRFDDEYFAYIRGADKDDDWTDPAVWRNANPAMGTIFTEDDMRADCERAKAIPSEQNNFKQRLLNIWTEQAVRWLDVAQWDACANPVDPESLRGRPCFVGIDLSSTKDLTAIVLFFPDADNYLMPFFFAPEEGARQRAETDRVPYPEWAGEGHMDLTPGNVVDYDWVRAKLDKLAKIYDIIEIGIDPWNAKQFTKQLQDDGFNVTEYRQGFASMSGAAKELEKLLLGRQLCHDGNPVMRWCIGNAATETDAAGNIKPSKKHSTERIDGVVSAVMAIGLACASPSAIAGPACITSD